MKRFILIIYVALVVVLAVATFVEQARGTAFIGELVYGSVWFCALWGVLAVLTLIVCIRMRLWRRVPLLLLHGSFLVILGGAFLTYTASAAFLPAAGQLPRAVLSRHGCTGGLY